MRIGSQNSPVAFRYKSNINADASGSTIKSGSNGPALILNYSKSISVNGGTWLGNLSTSSSWSTAHGNQIAYCYKSPNAKFSNMVFGATGDGFSIKQGCGGAVINHVRIKRAGDDAIESDRGSSVTANRVLVDSAFSGVSCRGEKIYNVSSGYTVRLTNSAMKFDRSAYVFKTDDRGKCKIVASGNVFYLPNESARRTIAPKNLSCPSKNTIVYTGGSKDFLNYLKNAKPSCYDVTTDKSVWDKAVSSW